VPELASAARDRCVPSGHGPVLVPSWRFYAGAQGSSFLFVALTFSFPKFTLAGDDLPKAAWKRSVGAPLESPGTKKPTLEPGHIDDFRDDSPARQMNPPRFL